MGFIESIEDLGHKIYEKLTNPKIVKYCTIIGMGFFLGGIIIGFFIAQFDLAGPGTDLAGYNIIDNYISDMGSYRYTPIPYFLDVGNMIGSILLLPCVFYLEKRLAPLPQKAEDLQNISRMRMRLGSFGFAWMILGLIGMFGTGLFSEDRTTSLDLHWLFTIIVFNGFALTSFFYGLLIMNYSTKVPKALGIYMIIAPMVMVVVLFFYGFQPFHEWLMLFTLLGWIIPLNVIFLTDINKELRSHHQP